LRGLSVIDEAEQRAGVVGGGIWCEIIDPRQHGREARPSAETSDRAAAQAADAHDDRSISHQRLSGLTCTVRS